MTPVHSLWLFDVLDILLVAVLFYRLLILVKGTRSAQMYVGLLVIVLIGTLAREFDLIAVKWIVESLKTVWLIAFVILFQPELRHALAQFGRTRYFRSFLRGENYGVPAEVVRAVESLAQRRHGPLIVMERNVGLRNFVETGTRIDAKVSAELLVTLFSPGSPLHDGAVIVREDTIVAASCILPLSSNPLTADLADNNQLVPTEFAAPGVGAPGAGIAPGSSASPSEDQFLRKREVESTAEGMPSGELDEEPPKADSASAGE